MHMLEIDYKLVNQLRDKTYRWSAQMPSLMHLYILIELL